VDHVVERTVESIGSLSGYDVHYSAACASVLGGVVGAKHRHFLEAVTQRGLNLLSGDRVVVIVRAIDQLIVRARPETVDVELSALQEASGKHAGICYARQGKHEIYRVETGDWEVNDLPAFEGACLSAILFLEDDRSISVDVYDLALSADQELSVCGGWYCGFNNHVVECDGFEALSFDLHFVRSRIDRIEWIVSFGRRSRFARDFGCDVGYLYCSSADYCSCLVVDGAHDNSFTGLCERRRAKQRGEDRRDEQQHH